MSDITTADVLSALARRDKPITNEPTAVDLMFGKLIIASVSGHIMTMIGQALCNTEGLDDKARKAIIEDVQGRLERILGGRECEGEGNGQ